MVKMDESRCCKRLFLQFYYHRTAEEGGWCGQAREIMVKFDILQVFNELRPVDLQDAAVRMKQADEEL